MKCLKGKVIQEINRDDFHHMIKDYTHIVMDIGTGEGEFIYGQARKNPGTLYIGLDSCAEMMAFPCNSLYPFAPMQLNEPYLILVMSKMTLVDHFDKRFFTSSRFPG